MSQWQMPPRNGPGAQRPLAGYLPEAMVLGLVGLFPSDRKTLFVGLMIP